ncbi:PEP-CTERM sorting domain-containing protein [Rugamonas apoptosis]|uniref:PEP-CTERM sorting domain-containing protein n=1 Tax=Rugamonas apoptosis TaxID=2758570 RepID=UPI001E587D15|nr:PEP-CTERM sorting domain-containing protein [Rugamonas apoptosis]
MTITLTRKLALGAAILALCASASATDVAAHIGYHNPGLDNSPGLPSADVSASHATNVQLDSSNLPVQPHGGYSSYMWLNASSAATGELATATDLAASGSVVASASWHDTIVNSGAAAQNYTFHFALSDGKLEVGGWTGDENLRDFRASYTAEVLVNGVAVWHAEQGLSLDGNGFHQSASGANIGSGTFSSTGARGTYELAGYTGTLNLGPVAAGQSLSVSYVLTSRGYWDDPAGCAYECGRVTATIGDPLGVNSARITAAVPEPETYAMLLAGLGLLGWAARRRQRA